MNLRLHRRHVHDCPNRGKEEGRREKCACPIYATGTIAGRRIRQSLETSNWDRAERRARELEAESLGEKIRKPVFEAVDAFIASRAADIEPSTLRRYRHILRPLVAFAETYSIDVMEDWTLDLLDRYRQSRPVGSLTWSKELDLIRQLFNFCCDRNWATCNIAKKVKGPRSPKPNPRHPYTQEEITAILAAADTFGQEPYERLRAKAMLLLMRRYGLRLSDVALLRRDAVTGSEITVRAQKNGVPVRFPLLPDVKAALDVLPLPAGAGPECPYFFWNGSGSREGRVNTCGRILQSVYRKSGVPNAFSHRFRHTLAVEILVKGGTIEDAANILGDDPAVVRQHYAVWCVQLQHHTSEVLLKVHSTQFGTPLAHEKNEAASALFSRFPMVPGVGLEPTRPFRARGF